MNPKAEISLQELKFPLRRFGLRNLGLGEGNCPGRAGKRGLDLLRG